VRAVVQRVSEASVRAGGATIAACGTGLLVLLGVARGDGPEQADRLAAKVARLRVFENERGRLERSLLDVGGEALVVSQFTLIADYERRGTLAGDRFAPGWKGNRPSFTEAARPEQAEPLYERFCDELRRLGARVETGVFGARMAVEIVNDGPVTIILDA
jgi:D-tyrosyl-tRNA(Tyr) deacylase